MSSNPDNRDNFYFKTFRIESLSDGVFAIAMTLLILEIKMPELTKIHNEQDLINYLYNLNHKFYSYFLSFIILGIYWIGHHRQFVFIKHSDRISLWINVWFLMFVSFLPFSTEILGEFNEYKTAIFLYGINLTFIGVLLWYNWGYSYKANLISKEQIDRITNEKIQRRYLLVPILYLTAIALCFIDPMVSLYTFLFVHVIFVFPSKFDVKIPGFNIKKVEPNKKVIKE